jgi:dipeptide/tripeptide permease
LTALTLSQANFDPASTVFSVFASLNIMAEHISRFNVVHRLQKRSLLVAINCIAGLSIFFFGYDQYESTSEQC